MNSFINESINLLNGMNACRCKQSNPLNFGADCQIRRFGVQSINFSDVGCRLPNSMIWGADFSDFGCRPSNLGIWGADHQFQRFSGGPSNSTMLGGSGRHAMYPYPRLHDMFLQRNIMIQERVFQWSKDII